MPPVTNMIAFSMTLLTLFKELISVTILTHGMTSMKTNTVAFKARALKLIVLIVMTSMIQL